MRLGRRRHGRRPRTRPVAGACLRECTLELPVGCGRTVDACSSHVVTARLRPGYAWVWPLDRKLTLWLASLAALTALNVGLYFSVGVWTSLAMVLLDWA